MYRLENNYFRFILNNVVRNVSCHELYSSVYKRDNFFSHYFVILFFNSNLKDFGYKLFCLFVYKSRISEVWLFLTGLFFFVGTTRVLWLFFETWCSEVLLSISRKSFWFQLSRCSLVFDSRVFFLMILSRVLVWCLSLNTCREVLLFLTIVLIYIVLR